MQFICHHKCHPVVGSWERPVRSFGYAVAVSVRSRVSQGAWTQTWAVPPSGRALRTRLASYLVSRSLFPNCWAADSKGTFLSPFSHPAELQGNKLWVEKAKPSFGSFLPRYYLEEKANFLDRMLAHRCITNIFFQPKLHFTVDVTEEWRKHSHCLKARRRYWTKTGIGGSQNNFVFSIHEPPGRQKRSWPVVSKMVGHTLGWLQITHGDMDGKHRASSSLFYQKWTKMKFYWYLLYGSTLVSILGPHVRWSHLWFNWWNIRVVKQGGVVGVPHTSFTLAMCWCSALSLCLVKWIYHLPSFN